MKQYKGVIFDLDGTLMDTIADLADAANKACAEYGISPYSYAQFQQMVGNGLENLIRLCVENSELSKTEKNDQTVKTILARFLHFYDLGYLNKTRPYEGIVEMLRELQQKNIKMGINTNKRELYSKAIVSHTLSEIYFINIYAEGCRFAKKPDPAAALQLAHEMGLSPKQILYIGDSDVDMKTGQAAGMDTVGVAWGFRGAEELKQNLATYIVESPSEIETLIG